MRKLRIQLTISTVVLLSHAPTQTPTIKSKLNELLMQSIAVQKNVVYTKMSKNMVEAATVLIGAVAAGNNQNLFLPNHSLSENAVNIINNLKIENIKAIIK